MIRPRPSSTLFPDTTLCRSRGNTLAQLGVAYALNGDMNAASRTFAEADAVNERADNAYAIQIVTWRSARLQVRSEEHTSELQSRQYLVCRLLLEKNINSRSPKKPPCEFPQRHTAPRSTVANH